MPILNNDTLDDPLLHDETVDFSGGVYSAARKNLLPENMLAEAINARISKTGQIVTRYGHEQVGDDTAGIYRVLGMAYFDTPDMEWLVRVVDNSGISSDVPVIQKHESDPAVTWVGISGYDPTEDLPLEIVQALNKLYFSNGTDAAHTWDGTSMAALGTTATDFPLAKYLVWFQGRMFAAGVSASPETVFFCDLLDPSNGHWSHTAKSFAVSSGDGDPIKSIAKWLGTTLAVLKRHSLHVANVDPSLTLGAAIPIQELHASIGCVSHRTVKRVGNDLFFLSDDGVRSLIRSEQDSGKEKISEPISAPLRDLFDRVNPAAVETACAESDGKRYLIALPIDSATQPSHVAVFNTMLNGGAGGWEGYWTGLTPTVFARSYFSGLRRLNFGQADGLVLQSRDHVALQNEAATDFEDNGTDIATTIDLRSHNFKEPKNDKKGLALELEFDASRADEVTVTAYRDEATEGTLLTTINSGLGGVGFPISFPLAFPAQGIKRVPQTLLDVEPFRELGLKIQSTSGKLALRSARLAAFLQTMPIGR